MREHYSSDERDLEDQKGQVELNARMAAVRDGVRGTLFDEVIGSETCFFEMQENQEPEGRGAAASIRPGQEGGAQDGPAEVPAPGGAVCGGHGRLRWLPAATCAPVPAASVSLPPWLC